MCSTSHSIYTFIYTDYRLDSYPAYSLIRRKKKMTNQDFIKKIGEAAVNLYSTYQILPSLTIAQFIKESNWGKSSLSAKYYNFAGMKWTKGCGYDYVELQTKEWDRTSQSYVTVMAKFRKTDSFESGVEMYYKFITGYKRYANLIGQTNSQQACMDIQKDGWATSPTYGESLYNDYILKYNLLEYDNLAILGKKIESTADELTGYDTYTVKRGDSLWQISYTYLGFGSKYKDIMRLNNLTSSTIYPGQVLKVPRKE